MAANKSILAWHFVGTTLRNGDPLPPDGEWLVWKGPLRMCKQGLHASRRIIDALHYSPGSTICRVRLAGDVQEDTDKMVGHRRKIIWRIDGEYVLRRFAKDCALSVADNWDMPAVVRQYLESDTEELREAARQAAWDAARDVAGWAAWQAARQAAGQAAWEAARDAAGDAAWEAAGEAAWWATGNALRDEQNKRLTRVVMAAHKKEVNQ